MSYFSLARSRPSAHSRFPAVAPPSPSPLPRSPSSTHLRRPLAVRTPPSAAVSHHSARRRSLRRRPCIPSRRRHTAALAPPPPSTARPAAPVHHQHCLRAVTPPPARTRTTALTPAPERRPRTVSPPLPPSTPCHRVTVSAPVILASHALQLHRAATHVSLHHIHAALPFASPSSQRRVLCFYCDRDGS
jgi:hypothetical protein